MANERLDRFTKLLKEIFELDKSDLDFGIYRVMNLRKTQIEEFLTQRLPQMVQETLAPFAQGSKEEIRAQMTQIEESVAGMGMTVDALPDTAPMKQKYIALQKSLAEGADLSALETDVYSALYSFFNRYYEDGDFISKRRYKEGVYAIPYEGEEVKLYWANQDQYYIKTSENFKDYTFVFDGITVHFRLVDATTEQNNNKESKDAKRTFMLFTEDEENYPGIKTFEYDAEAREIVIRFVYDIPEDKKRKYAEENYDAIQKWILSLRDAELIALLAPIPAGKGKETTTLLEKHLKGYVAKNTFDYFIHKDLRGFLTRELDFFIKSEVMHLEDLDTGSEARVETYLAKIKAIKRVGKIIIDFLAQIEDFQKKLWLKKKFVVETNWCVTLDKIDESFWAEIIDNKAQIDEWIAMYAIDEAEDWSNPPTVEFLRQNQNLIVDTKHFPNTFKFALLESIPDLDEQTNGVMIHSDNYQALRLLLERYSEKIQLTYIDPPYNTDASKILYKNGYEHSSWVSLIESRLFEGRKLMSSTGVIEVAIDDYEMRYLNTCMDQVFGIDNAISNIAILTNPKGRDQGFIAQAHDYTVMYARNKALAETHNFVLTEEELAKKFSKTKDGEALRELPLKRTGSGKFREDRPYMYFPFFYSPAKDELMVIPEDLYKKIYDAATDSFDDQFVSNIIKKYEKEGYVAVLPLSSKGEKFRWRWGYKSCVAGVKSGVLFCKAVRGGGYAVYQYDFADEEATPKSLWFGEKYDASSKGTNLLESIIPNNPFDFPKSLYTVEDNIIIGASGTDIVLDYFAGSGTTGHAVVDLNRRLEDSNRRYILIDMGEHFNSVIHPRMKKVVYAPDWKDGKPQQRDGGVPQIIKYMRLESYEDSATFKQALNANATGNTQKAKDERALMEEYGKSIIMDYSYKYFYSDGYGKDYRIYNLQKSIVEEQRHLYLVGCLLSFYQQMKVFETKADELREFHIEKPLLVFVGNRVTAPVKSSGLSQAEKELLTDVEEVLVFLNTFLSNRAKAIESIRAVLNEDTGLYDGSGKDLFYGDFSALQDIFGHDIDPAAVFADILHIVFNTDGNADEPRLRLENIRQVSGEIGLKVDEYGDYFGVINIGDTSGLLKNCEQKGIIVSTEEFVSDSLFRSINAQNSKIKMLIGSRKFTEGWNSWRVSTMGLINFAKGEGSQAIQLFGRGVRLKGYEGCLKRSRMLDAGVKPPKHIELLETLTIFGVKAQYMEDFKSYLEQEGTPTNETVHEFRLPVISRFNEVQGKKLHVIKVKDGANFKQQARRLVLDKPDQGFLRYLLKSKTIIDCRSKIQSIDSTFSFKIEAMPEEHVLPANVLPLLDIQRIFEELQQYKSEKRYFNISIVADKLLEILQTEGWYVLLIPKHHLEINTLAKLEAATDYAIMALKSYMDKFFKYEKERWEAPMLEYAILDADDSNFVDEYTITYAQQHPLDTTSEELETFISEISTILQANNGLDVYKKDSFHGRMVMFDFRSHLYAPLICLEKSNLKIQVSPVALNSDEMIFVDYLKEYVESHSSELEGKSLYLLRNKSKVGMGFFEAGNFYPDYILWIDTEDKQYISFIDPKGLMHIRPDDPKVEFYKTIKELEARLAPTADGKTVVLNSFIMSGSKSSELRLWWSTPEVEADRAYREARNVYTLDNTECVELMIAKILQQ